MDTIFEVLKTLQRCTFQTYNRRIANEDQHRAMMSTAQIINNQCSNRMMD